MKKIIFLLVTGTFFAFQASGQVKIYDKDIKAHDDCKTISQFKKKLGIETTSQTYELNGEFIVELYEEGTGKFVGFVGDISKFDIKDLTYYKQDQRMNYLMSKYAAPIAVAIYEKRVWITMTANEAKESWGQPNDINRTITEKNTSEQWVYNNGRYLYFDNGILTTIQD